MGPVPPRTPRRSDALTRERVVAAAVELLDAGGEAGLTFRALAAHLATGPGALYGHVADKDDLLAAAADAVLARVTTSGDGPAAAVRAAALGLFDAIDAHPWVAAPLQREPWRPAMARLWEALGAPLVDLGVPEAALFDCASALVGYVLGVAGQNAANARRADGRDRASFLGGLADRWAADEGSFLRRVAPQLRDHDDRQQFLAGVDLVLAGAATLRP